MARCNAVLVTASGTRIALGDTTARHVLHVATQCASREQLEDILEGVIRTEYPDGTPYDAPRGALGGLCLEAAYAIRSRSPVQLARTISLCHVLHYWGMADVLERIARHARGMGAHDELVSAVCYR
ncbi:MAG: hypothetical protein D6746_16355 [Bacteroidetes bacterium]|nr:MAG: hypothetical protein D6746_16355 [Bacteroidota bacterium]